MEKPQSLTNVVCIPIQTFFMHFQGYIVSVFKKLILLLDKNF